VYELHVSFASTCLNKDFDFHEFGFGETHMPFLFYRLLVLSDVLPHPKTLFSRHVCAID
jgi:hypothetical protein